LPGHLQKGRSCTFDHPPGQLHGRAGKRSTLEDGERILLRAVALRPGSLEARLLLVQNRLRMRRAARHSLVCASSGPAAALVATHLQ